MGDQNSMYQGIEGNRKSYRIVISVIPKSPHPPLNAVENQQVAKTYLDQMILGLGMKTLYG